MKRRRKRDPSYRLKCKLYGQIYAIKRKIIKAGLANKADLDRFDLHNFKAIDFLGVPLEFFYLFCRWCCLKGKPLIYTLYVICVMSLFIALLCLENLDWLRFVLDHVISLREIICNCRHRTLEEIIAAIKEACHWTNLRPKVALANLQKSGSSDPKYSNEQVGDIVDFVASLPPEERAMANFNTNPAVWDREDGSCWVECSDCGRWRTHICEGIKPPRKIGEEEHYTCRFCLDNPGWCDLLPPPPGFNPQTEEEEGEEEEGEKEQGEEEEDD